MKVKQSPVNDHETWHRVFVGLGSNLGDSEGLLNQACLAMKTWSRVRNFRASRWYASKPQGPQDQPDFVNGVCCFDTTYSPHDLLEQLQMLEQALGKIKRRHWGERIIDLDMICYDQLRLSSPELSLPHPMAGLRDFVLLPMLELDSQMNLPGLGSAQACLDALPETFVYRPLTEAKRVNE